MRHGIELDIDVAAVGSEFCAVFGIQGHVAHNVNHVVLEPPRGQRGEDPEGWAKRAGRHPHGSASQLRQ